MATHSENYANGYDAETVFGDEAVLSGSQIVDVGSDKILTNLTGLVAATAYDFDIDINGAGNSQKGITTGADTSYKAVIALMNAEITGALFELIGGDLKCTTSKLGGVTSSILIAAGTGGDPDLFATLTGYVAINAAVAGVALTAQSQPFNEPQVFPVKEFMQNAFESAGQGKSTKITITTDTTIFPGEKTQFVQNAIAITRAIAGTGGAVPVSSWAEGFYDGKRYKKASGCYDTQYALNIPTPTDTNAPKESIKYNAYNVLDAVAGTIPDWLATQSNEHSDFSITINAVALNDWINADLTIDKEYTDKPAGQELHLYPYLKTHAWTLAVSTYDYPGCLDDLETFTASLFSVVITGWYTAGATPKTLTLTNMKVQPGSTNIKEMPEKGIKEYSFTLEIGGASTAVLT